MPLESPLNEAAEAKLKQIREQIDAALQDLVADMLAVATAERDTAISEAQAQGAAAAEEARAEVEKIRGEVEKVRADSEATLAERLAAAQSQAAEAAKDAAASSLQDRIAAIEQDAERRVAEARAQVAAQAEDDRASERQCDLACLERLVDAVRDFDGATTLSQVLDKLAEHAASQIGRVAVLVVRENDLRPWRSFGFDQSTEEMAAMKLPLDAPTVVRRAIDTAARATTGNGEDIALEPLPFAALPTDRVGLALPLNVGVRTVAVLYADEGIGGEPAVPSAWPEVLEILSRHAACRLEMLTVARAYGLHTHEAAAAREVTYSAVAGADSGPGSTASAAAVAEPFDSARETDSRLAQGRAAMTPPAGGRPPSLATDKPVDSTPRAQASRQISEEDASALRYARLLISEIKLYHEDAVNEGRRDGNLLARLGPEIARARRLYEERIPAEVRGRADHFGQELVRTLANGDPRLLGQS